MSVSYRHRFVRLLLPVLALAAFRGAHAQPRPDVAAVENRAAAATRFVEHFGAGWTLRLDERVGTPTSIFLETPSAVPVRTLRSIPTKGTTDAARATSFLVEYKDLFSYRPGTDDLQLRRGVSFDEQVKFDQMYRGLRVHRGSLAFTVHDRAVTTYSGTFLPGINVATTPALGARDAERAAVTAIDSAPDREAQPAELVVFPADGQYALAYEVTVRAGVRVYRVFVDAVGGGILSVEDLTMEFVPSGSWVGSTSPVPSAPVSPVMVGDLASGAGHGLPTGTGNVYPDNPRDTPVASVQLPHLNGNGRLQGTYATAKNLVVADASSATSAFSYATTDTHFDEVNVYYHVDRFAAHMLSRGFAGMGRSQVAQVHWNGDNAQFDPSSLVLRFGDGATVFNDLARENDVVYHEYGHAVQSRYGIQYDGGETGAFQEATSDLLAASYVNEPYIGEWVTKCTDVGHLRSLVTSSTTFNYSNRNNLEYAYCSARGGYLAPKGNHYAIGMVWSGAIWDLRVAAGAETTEKLVVKSLSYLSAYPSFANARDALIQADNALYGGANNCKIRDALGRRGVGTVCPSDVPTGLHVVNLGATTGSPVLQWTAPAAGAASSYKVYRSVDWSTDPPQPIATVTTTSYTDGALESSHFGASGGAFYTVAAIKNGIQSAKSNEAYAFVKAPGQPYSAGPVDLAGPASLGTSAPDVFTVHGVGPNPVRGSGALRVDLPETARVTARVYDTLGRLVLTVEDGERPAGRYALPVNASALPAGLYVYRVEAGGSSAAGTFTVVR